MKPALRNSLLSTFSNLFDDEFFNSNFFRESSLPAVNVREEADGYQIEVIAPGMKKEGFKLEINDGIITISAENKSETEEKKDAYRRKEYSFKAFSRSFTLPENAQADSAQATYADGILKIDLKKNLIVPKSNAKVIPIG